MDQKFQPPPVVDNTQQKRITQLEEALRASQEALRTSQTKITELETTVCRLQSKISDEEQKVCIVCSLFGMGLWAE